MYWIGKLQEDFNFASNDLHEDPRKYYYILSNYRNRIFYLPRNDEHYGEMNVLIEEIRSAKKSDLNDLAEYFINKASDKGWDLR